MKCLAAIACALLCGACASTTKPVATFQAPSLAPVEQAVTRVEQHVSGAKDAARKLADATDEKAKQNKAWQDAYNQLNSELDSAYLQLQTTKDELASKKLEIGDVVNRANIEITDVAKERDQAKAQLTPLKASRHGWVMRFWMASGVAMAATAWILRGPLFALVKLIPLAGI